LVFYDFFLFSEIRDLLQKILAHQRYLRVQVDKLVNSNEQTVMEGNKGSEANKFWSETNFPCKTKEQLYEIEKKLSNDDFKQYLVSTITQVTY
jgi:hypothetical protein